MYCFFHRIIFQNLWGKKMRQWEIVYKEKKTCAEKLTVKHERAQEHFDRNKSWKPSYWSENDTLETKT